MDAETLKHHEAQLSALETELEAELEAVSDESAPVQLDSVMGRVSRGDAMQAQQVALEVRRQRQKRLRTVQAARRRVLNGSYGTCADCREPISAARLEAFPETPSCVRCAPSQ